MPRIRAVIFDLDDTLYDCAGTLVSDARRRAAQAMRAEGVDAPLEKILELFEEYEKLLGPRTRIFQRIIEELGGNGDALKAALKAYNSEDVGEIHPFPDVISTLKALRERGLRLFLVTMGAHARQMKKISQLGIRQYFDDAIVCDTEIGDRLIDSYRYILREHRLRPSNVLVVGDRLHEEVSAGNELGMFTAHFLHGRFKALKPSAPFERPTLRIRKISQVPATIALLDMGIPPTDLRIVAIGGGTGMPIVLEGMKCFTERLTAIVTVTDSGRSSGVIRRELDMLPPGDARNCLTALTEIVALSDSEAREWYLFKLFNYRFDKGQLKCMSLGNLLMAALTDITGSFQKAIENVSSILGVTGRVLPSTMENVSLCAKLENGEKVCEEENVRKENKSRIDRVFLKPSAPKSLPDVENEIQLADLVVIGPGSLYTSIITNLLVPGIRNAIAKCDAPVVYVCNIVMQPGQTDGYCVSDHVKAIVDHVGEGVIDYVLVNDAYPPADALQRYEEGGAYLALHENGDEICGA